MGREAWPTIIRKAVQFVAAKGASWKHKEWEDFRNEVLRSYPEADEARLALILEEKKTEYLLLYPRTELEQKPLLAEYGTLRKEIEDGLAEVSVIERYVLLGAAGVWTWLLTNPTRLQSPASRLAWLIPIVLAIFGALKSLGLYLHITVVGDYIESTLEPPLRLGWQSYFKTRTGVRFVISVVFWVVFLIATILAAWQAPAP